MDDKCTKMHVSGGPVYQRPARRDTINSVSPSPPAFELHLLVFHSFSFKHEHKHEQTFTTKMVLVTELTKKLGLTVPVVQGGMQVSSKNV